MEIQCNPLHGMCMLFVPVCMKHALHDKLRDSRNTMHKNKNHFFKEKINSQPHAQGTYPCMVYSITSLHKMATSGGREYCGMIIGSVCVLCLRSHLSRMWKNAENSSNYATPCIVMRLVCFTLVLYIRTCVCIHRNFNY